MLVRCSVASRVRLNTPESRSARLRRSVWSSSASRPGGFLPGLLAALPITVRIPEDTYGGDPLPVYLPHLTLAAALSESHLAFASCWVHPPFRLFAMQVEYLGSKQTCCVPPLLVGRVPIGPSHLA